MDINTIELSPALLAGLYPASLVDTGEITTKPGAGEKKTEVNEPAAVPDATPASLPAWKWLGENDRKILIAVQYRDAVHIPDEQLAFLTAMLSACKLSLADVAIVNLPRQPQPATYARLQEQFNPRIALLFDIEPAGFGLPMSFPHFQIQPFSGCSFVYAPALETLEHNKDLKRELWTALKRLFNV